MHETAYVEEFWCERALTLRAGSSEGGDQEGEEERRGAHHARREGWAQVEQATLGAPSAAVAPLRCHQSWWGPGLELSSGTGARSVVLLYWSTL